MAIANADIALVFAVKAFFNGGVYLLLKLPAVGQGQFYGGYWLDGAVYLDGRLGVEEDDQLGAIGIAGIKVPPFIGTLASISAHAVFPEFNLVPGQSQFVVVKIIVGMDGCLDFSHGVFLLVCLKLL